MGKRKAHYKAKHAGRTGQFFRQHEAGKAAKRKAQTKEKKTAGGFEEWAESMVENPLKFLEYTALIILAAALIKILIA